MGEEKVSGGTVVATVELREEGRREEEGTKAFAGGAECEEEVEGEKGKDAIKEMVW